MRESEAKIAFPILLRAMSGRIRQAASAASQLREMLDAAEGGSAEQIAERSRLRAFCLSVGALLAPLTAIDGDEGEER